VDKPSKHKGLSTFLFLGFCLKNTNKKTL